MHSAEPMSVALLTDALAVLDLRLVPYRGCLVRQVVFDAASVDTWLESTGGDIAAVELVVNHVHLYDVVQQHADTDLPELEELGRRIAEVWEHLARARYPEHRLTVTFATEPDEYGPTVSVFQATEHAD